ncbi:protein STRICTOSIDINE SYNTHASE-LIKE 5-like [Rhodamnia argentea]|uniref:Protein STRICTOSIDINE SYNTHASE-LIKE 5-like n=1 Tax=Rhodamnia argentea TaxID=178133 RepID=A0A8B8PP59_9MYRT|nr:protein STRICTOSIDINE SYNTHASE-LIKE 5-like [Rhodamnia argentea]XP_030536002.1 protein STRICTOSIDINE SYNTHASE-LIKE 5-like [Rhodamnia argentea]XP_048140084.1 protein STRICTOSIDINE SYNTHASE-LIKE 5-like [Rhodamnia argentea]
MSESRTDLPPPRPAKSSLKPSLTVPLLSILAPILAVTVLYRHEPLDPAPLPFEGLSVTVAAPRENGRMLRGAEMVGAGRMVGPEDVAYDPASGDIYVGCADGWVKRVRVSDSGGDSAVEDWVNTGGRPLGLALGRDGEVIVCDPFKGLLNVSKDGTMELLTDEAEGVKFKLTDAAAVARDGTIYFTDASYKYTFKEFIWDFLEGRPHGRFLSYDPATKETRVLARDLYFPNGVALSPDQSFVIFCETVMRWCKRYYINGDRTGHIDTFIHGLPGYPDNIRYDGEGHYWIALSTGKSMSWDLALKHPFIRKAIAIMERLNKRPAMEKNSGIFQVDTEGKPVAHYYDPKLSLLSSGTKIGDYLYCGSLHYPHILRLKLD